MSGSVEYRGYKIILRQAKDFFANIIGPDGLALRDTPTATREEGEAVLIVRAKALVDADIEYVKNAKS